MKSLVSSKKMRKSFLRAVSLILSIAMMIFVASPVFAATNGTAEEVYQVLNISDEIALTNHDGIDVINIKTGQFEKIAPEELKQYSGIAVNKNQLINLDHKSIIGLLDEGLAFMIYGQNVSMDTLTKFLEEDGFRIENDPITTESTSAVYVLKTNNMTNYGIIADLTDNFEVEDKEGDLLTAEEFYAKHGIAREQHDPLSFLKEIINTKNENFTIESKPLTIQSAPPNWNSIQFDFWHDLGSYFGKMRGLVYCYKLQHGSSTSYWDFVSAMTAAANNSSTLVNWYKIRLYVNFSSQQEIDWTYLESNRGSYTVSLSFGSLPTVSWSTSTSAQTIGNYVYTNAVEWRSSPTGNPWGQAFKIEPGIRASNTSGDMVIRRYYQSEFYNSSYGSARTEFLYSTAYLSDR